MAGRLARWQTRAAERPKLNPGAHEHSEHTQQKALVDLIAASVRAELAAEFAKIYDGFARVCDTLDRQGACGYATLARLETLENALGVQDSAVEVERGRRALSSGAPAPRTKDATTAMTATAAQIHFRKGELPTEEPSEALSRLFAAACRGNLEVAEALHAGAKFPIGALRSVAADLRRSDMSERGERRRETSGGNSAHSRAVKWLLEQIARADPEGLVRSSPSATSVEAADWAELVSSWAADEL
jgi:hypothetical protein